MPSTQITRRCVFCATVFLALAACNVLPGQAPAPTATRAPQPSATLAPLATLAPPTPTAVLPSPTPATPANSTKAAGLRVSLGRLLSEHVVLASSATAAALANRQKDFEAAAKALDDNSLDLSKAVGAAYGDAAEKAYLPLWRKHVGLLVDYTTGIVTKNKTKSDKAVNDLNAFADEFGTFFNTTNPSLPKATVADAVKEHSAALKSVVDAQGAGDHAKAYAAIRKAVTHSELMGFTIAAGTVKQFPDKYPGDVNANGATLRAQLNLWLAEHAYLLSAATGAGLGARDADFKGAASAVDANSADLAQALGFFYGDAAGKNFLALWRKHIGLVLDYTGGVAIKDKTKADKAAGELTAYGDELGAFFNTASPSLPKSAVNDLVKQHILSLKDVVDAQAAGDNAKAYTALRKAYAHMATLADPLADTLVSQFPDKIK